MIRSTALLALVLSGFPATPLGADVLSLAVELNGGLRDCEWLYRDVHEWGREQGDASRYLLEERVEDHRRIEWLIARAEQGRNEVQAEATPASFEALSAFVASFSTACATVISPAGSMEGYAAKVERELAAARSARTRLEGVLGQSLDQAIVRTDPAEYQRKKAEWETFQKAREQEERRRQELEREALERAERERQERRAGAGDRSEDRGKEFLEGQELGQKMLAWHPEYRSRVIEIKRSFGALLEATKSGTPESLQLACVRMSRALRELKKEPDPLASPDPAVSSALRQAYSELRRLSVNCLDGGPPVVAAGLETVQQSLREAARALAPYDLQP